MRVNSTGCWKLLVHFHTQWIESFLRNPKATSCNSSPVSCKLASRSAEPSWDLSFIFGSDPQSTRWTLLDQCSLPWFTSVLVPFSESQTEETSMPSWLRVREQLISTGDLEFGSSSSQRSSPTLHIEGFDPITSSASAGFSILVGTCCITFTEIPSFRLRHRPPWGVQYAIRSSLSGVL
jgi:hypothetical protein